jgi:arabinosaccharide transport system substrate-binding protein
MPLGRSSPGVEPDFGGWRAMIEKFPYGRAPFWLLVVAIASSVIRMAVSGRSDRPDLLFVTFSRTHLETYEKVASEFEVKHHVNVRFQYANYKALQSRLENAMLAHADVPDMVEVFEGSLGFLTRGPAADVGLTDFTDRIRSEKLDQRLVASRFSLWSTQGRTYAIPHDVHPVMLAYRRDIVERLGIDVTALDTWDKFAEVGRRITRDEDGDGVIDHYMLDLPDDGQWGIESLLLQRGGGLFDAAGNVTFDDDTTARVIHWYIEQTHGPHRITYDAGQDQPLLKIMSDGLVLFYITPDWRSGMFQHDLPKLAGKMALMPMPAWEPGGRRTTVWGGTGLVITKQTKHPDLAWQLAQFLYLNAKESGARFLGTNIVPILKEAWTLPELDAPSPYYSNQPIGRLYTDLAPSTPPRYVTALTAVAQQKLNQAYSRSLEHYKRFGLNGLDQAIHEELVHAADYVRIRAARDQALAGAQ